MADAKDGGEFLERGVRLLADVGLKFLGIELAPGSPGRFRGERPRGGGGQIAVDRAPPHGKAARRLGLGTAGLNKLDDPFASIQRVSFHPQSLSPSVPMSMLIAILRWL